MQTQKSAYEVERERRIEENKKKIQELGLAQAAADLEGSLAKPAAKQQRKKKDKVPAELVETRRSERPRKEVSYCEMERPVRVHTPTDYSERIKGMSLDAETAEKLRQEMESKRSSSGKAGKGRGPIDSGKGVRIQGGRVYDSKHGVTCHWCRQKTLEDHVTCTNPCCGNGKRMPLSFCAKCLKNRHGEDFEAADASGEWWCPACRGSCGPGCVICCNCGPCRKRAGLEPTHQVVKLARDAGFNNVHDYLVHLVTGETAEQISARKLQHSWGSWLKQDSSDASEQTGGGCSADCGHHHEAAELADSSASEQQQDAVAAAATDRQVGKVTDYFRCSKPASSRRKAGKAGSSKAACGKRKAAEAVEQQDSRGEEDDTTTAADMDDAPMLSSQDTKLSRKQRMMQRMGLAPVTVC